MRVTKKNSLNTNVITQIGIVVRDIQTTAAKYATFFQTKIPDVIITGTQSEAHTQFRGKPSNAQAKLAFFHFKNITIELIEPIGTPSTWQEFLDTKGEGVHHIAFQIKHGDRVMNLLQSQGVNIEQNGDYRGGCYKYMDTTDSLKIILELLETKL
jgi:catechol 2,3-dioxygenase-like lactoylglutathione lyase family enzyme